MILKDHDIRKQSFRTRQYFTDFVSATNCSRLILYKAILVMDNPFCYCDLIIGKGCSTGKFIDTDLTITKLKQLFTRSINKGTIYKEESLSVICNEIIKKTHEYHESKDKNEKEILFDTPYKFYVQTDFERDYGWAYEKDRIVKQGDEYGKTRPFYIVGIIIEDYYSSRFFIDESEPRNGTFEVLTPINNGIKTEKQRVYNVDFDIKNRNNKEIGDLGELIILDYEKEYLRKLGKPDLADRVVLTKDTLGNTAPYDILSFTREGQEKHIEVKTTEKDFNEPFYMSASESKYAKKNKNRYYLYRVYNLNRIANKANIVILKDLSTCNFEISEYKVLII